MKSAQHGRPTSAVEVGNISPHGFWLLLGDREVFVPFEKFPWFREAPVGHILNVQLPSSHHLYWPDLDVDLDVESLEHPERFPLVSKVRPANGKSPSRARAGRRKSAPRRGTRR